MWSLFEGANIPPDGPLFPEPTFSYRDPYGVEIQEGTTGAGYRRPTGRVVVEERRVVGMIHPRHRW